MTKKFDYSYLTPIDPIYPTCKGVLAELRIYPALQTCEEISRILGISPSYAQNKGDIIKNSRGRVRIARKTGWFLSSKGCLTSLDLRDHLNWLIDQLLPCETELKLLQNTADIKMNITCVWESAAGHGGPTLWPEHMVALARLNLECSFDIYFFDDE